MINEIKNNTRQEFDNDNYIKIATQAWKLSHECRYNESIELYSIAIEMKDDSNLRLDRGYCYYSTNKAHEACIDFDKSMELGGETTCYWLETINYLIHLHDWRMAYNQRVRLAQYGYVPALEASTPSATPQHVDTLIKTVERALSAPKTDDAPSPDQRHQLHKEKILFLFCAFKSGNPSLQPTEVPYMLSASASAAGIEHSTVFVDPLYAPYFHSQESITACEDAIVTALATNPSLIIVDTNFRNNLGSWSPEKLSKAVHKIGGKLLAYCPDDWGKLKYDSPWGQIADAVWTPEPKTDDDPKSISAWPVGAYDFPRRDAFAARDIPAMFSGTLYYDRGLWVTRMVTESPPWYLRFIMNGHGDSKESMQEDLGRCQSIVNFGRRGDESVIVTGRVMEAAAAGAMLMEQAGSKTDRLFTPYREYIPFHTWTDLSAARKLVDQRPELARAIASSAQRKERERYHPNAFWATLNPLFS